MARVKKVRFTSLKWIDAKIRQLLVARRNVCHDTLQNTSVELLVERLKQGSEIEPDWAKHLGELITLFSYSARGARKLC